MEDISGPSGSTALFTLVLRNWGLIIWTPLTIKMGGQERAEATKFCLGTVNYLLKVDHSYNQVPLHCPNFSAHFKNEMSLKSLS